MGSLASRPKVPAQPQVVFVPAPTAPTPTSSVSPSESVDTPAAEDTGADNEALRSEQRTKSLLQRSRSRFGTVQTGFRGLLSTLGSAGQRKTLLGE